MSDKAKKLDEFDEALADFKPSGGAGAPDEFEAALSDFKPGATPPPSSPQPHVTELPVQKIEGELPKPPWYESLARGAYQGATLGFGDELAGQVVAALTDQPATEATQDIREADAQAAKAHPVLNFAGNAIGAIPGAMATGGGSLATRTGVGGLALAANNIGRGTGNLSERLEQSDQAIKEHPIATGLALATPALAQGAASALKSLAGRAEPAADKLRTHTFMTPAQRSTYEAAKGPGSLAKLGKAAEDEGLLKARGWTSWLKPRTASDVSANAQEALTRSGKTIGALEDEFTGAGANPQVPVRAMIDELRDKASAASDMVDPLSHSTGADTFNKFADKLAAVPPAGAEGAERGALTLEQAIANKRDLGSNVNWMRNANTSDSPAAEVARKYLFGGLKDKISSTLENEAAAGRIDPQKVAAYKRANTTFSTAAAVADPALKMAERNEQSGLSLRDLLAGSALGGGPVGGLATLAAKGSRGSGASMTARGLDTVAGLAKGSSAAADALSKAPAVSGAMGASTYDARASTPIEKAAQARPGAPKHEIEKSANSDLKQTIQQAAQKTSKWWKHLINR